MGGNNNPAISAPVALPTGQVNGNDFVFTFTRSDSAEFPDLQATVEMSNDLSTWPVVLTIGADTASSSAGVTVVENGVDDDLITISLPNDSEPRRFARLVLTEAP